MTDSEHNLVPPTVVGVLSVILDCATKGFMLIVVFQPSKI